MAINAVLRPGDAGYEQVAGAFQKGRVGNLSPFPQNAYALGYKWQLVQDNDEIRFVMVSGAGEGIGTYTGTSFDTQAGQNLTTSKRTSRSKTVKKEE